MPDDDHKYNAISRALHAMHSIDQKQATNPHDAEMYKQKISAFIILAACLGLKHLHGNVYEDAYGKHFVQTKYGYVPAEIHNENLVIKDLYKQLHDVQNKTAEQLKQYNLQIEELQRAVTYLANDKIELRKQNDELQKKADHLQWVLKEINSQTLQTEKFMDIIKIIKSIQKVLNQHQFTPAIKLYHIDILIGRIKKIVE